MHYKIVPFLSLQCLIGHRDLVMNCIIKVTAMISQIQQAVNTSTPTKITIDNFQKRQKKIFTSESTYIELDNTVNNYCFTFN